MKRHRFTVAWVVLVALTACGGPPSTVSPTRPGPPTVMPVPADALVIQNGTVIPGTGAEPIPNSVVVIQKERILAAGSAGMFAIPTGVKTIDARGGAILPGIINAHAHSVSSFFARRANFLLKGVTSVCDLGSTLNDMADFALEDTPQAAAARGFKAGPIITVPGGYPGPDDGYMAYPISSAAEGRAAVADLAGRGADVIKIALDETYADKPWPMLNLEQVSAIVQEAHARGKPVRAHIRQAAVLDLVLKAQVDVIDHAPSTFGTAAHARQMIENLTPYTVPDEYTVLLKRMVAQNVIMVPTLDVMTKQCEAPGRSPEQLEICYGFFLEPVHAFHALGGKIGLGNDYGAPWDVESGMPLREMRLLMEAGLAPKDVIEAGTRVAAQACGHGQELGTLEPGKLADVIVVDGNPLEDIEALGRVTMVIKGGRVAGP